MHFPEFMSSVFEFGCEGEAVTTEQICKVYKLWCKSNACSEVSLRRLQNWIGNNAEKFKIEKKQIGAKKLKGYAGLKIRSEWSQNIVI